MASAIALAMTCMCAIACSRSRAASAAIAGDVGFDVRHEVLDVTVQQSGHRDERRAAGGRGRHEAREVVLVVEEPALRERAWRRRRACGPRARSRRRTACAAPRVGRRRGRRRRRRSLRSRRSAPSCSRRARVTAAAGLSSPAPTSASSVATRSACSESSESRVDAQLDRGEHDGMLRVGDGEVRARVGGDAEHRDGRRRRLGARSAPGRRRRSRPRASRARRPRSSRLASPVLGAEVLTAGPPRDGSPG